MKNPAMYYAFLNAAHRSVKAHGMGYAPVPKLTERVVALLQRNSFIPSR